MDADTTAYRQGIGFEEALRQTLTRKQELRSMTSAQRKEKEMMCAHDGDQDIKDLEKQTELLRIEEQQARKGWSEAEGRYGPNHPLTGQHQTAAVNAEARRVEVEKKLEKAIMNNHMENNGIDRNEPERRKGGRGR